MTADHHDVAVIGVDGARERLGEAGIADVVVLPAGELGDAVFDEATHTWTVPTVRARVVVADQIRSGRDHLAPYLGIAANGVPNYFSVTGTGETAAARLDYIVECLREMRSTHSTRIEVRFSTQRTWCLRATGGDDATFWRRMRRRIPTDFDLSSHIGIADEVYDGGASIRIGTDEHRVRVRLSGRLDPLDGRYHWQGTVSEGLPEGVAMQPVAVSIGSQTSDGRITERTQQGGYSVAGVGAPPYPLHDVDVVVPRR